MLPVISTGKNLFIVSICFNVKVQIDNVWVSWKDLKVQHLCSWLTATLMQSTPESSYPCYSWIPEKTLRVHFRNVLNTATTCDIRKESEAMKTDNESQKLVILFALLSADRKSYSKGFSVWQEVAAKLWSNSTTKRKSNWWMPTKRWIKPMEQWLKAAWTTPTAVANSSKKGLHGSKNKQRED